MPTTMKWCAPCPDAPPLEVRPCTSGSSSIRAHRAHSEVDVSADRIGLAETSSRTSAGCTDGESPAITAGAGGRRTTSRQFRIVFEAGGLRRLGTSTSASTKSRTSTRAARRARRRRVDTRPHLLRRAESIRDERAAAAECRLMERSPKEDHDLIAGRNRRNQRCPRDSERSTLPGRLSGSLTHRLVSLSLPPRDTSKRPAACADGARRGCLACRRINAVPLLTLTRHESQRECC